ncbi:MAG: hypothetical protein R3300_15475, partial [Candidatus Promineifilaceae bacterium]|nr:hypothetical protein [Candidatus Promineifilaceae bacterium]
NRDGRAELLLARFATLELLDPGVGARQYSEAWAFRLGAEPQTMLVADVDGDQQSELLVGTRDGRVQALSSAGLPLWEVELGGIVTHLALASTLDENAPQLVAVYNDVSSPDSSSEGLSGHVAILRPDGKSVSQSHIDGPVSSLLIADINRSGPPEILLGTSDGQVVARSLSGDDFWSTRIDGSVESLSVVSGLRGAEIIVSSGANRLERINHKGSGQKELGQYVADIVAVEQRVRGQDLLPILLIALEDGTVRGLDSQGSQLWLTTVEGLSGPMLATGESLLLATENGQVARLSLQGDLQWRTGDLERITTMYWGDLDGDVQPDLAVGNNLGTVALISADGLRAWGQLRLNSAVEQIVALPPEPGAPAELATLTDNGVVQLFRSQANRPPLLISPEEEVSPGRYSITVSVVDVDGDSVTVDLEVLNPDTQRWDLVDTKVAPDGNDTLLWPLDPPEGPNGIRYRFSYDDGTHQGQLSPLSGPAAVRSGPVVANFALLGFLALSATAAAVLLVRQSRSPASQAKRLFEQARERPAAVIELIEADYQETHASPDLLLNLANRARKADNQLLADLADGLFLLPTRPESGLHIVVEALETAADAATPWHGLHRWTVLFRTAHTLYGAPSISELSLMRGRLSLLQQHVLPNGSDEQPFNLLMPALETVHDGERVDLSADRLLYLREAARKLEDATGSLTDEPASVERTVARVLAERWLGLIRAGIEELQGRAQLSVNLVTKRLVPDDDAVVAIEVQNVGRAPAHNLQVVLADDPTYAIRRQPEKAPLLLPGRKRLFHASFAPGSSRRFRVLFNLHYQDKNGQDRSLPYADMVHLLATEREFAPIDNPYAPGMPLRQNSLLFFGREDLFEFIAQNAHSEAARNVLILVGQRRTGKTSALLQLRRHLPPSLVPVYIDCQSLGVIPGMPALFHNLAWTIADSLGEHGIELPVPPLSAWQSDPGGHFQRDFIAGAQARLPADNTILLVFDEFEVFEDLVNDEILPPTLFTYMRHLMQHGEGLSFIFAGTHRLEDMSTDYWSVLFNIALYRQVGFLDSEAARRLIQEPVSPQLVFDDLAIDKILRVTAGHPYFLQLVCYALVNRANTERRGYVTISDVNAALEQMLRLGEVHFAYLWQRSTYGERALLAALARASDQDQPFHLEDLVDYLERYNIRLDAAEATAAVGRLIQREIVRELADQHTPTYELRIGLVGLWVAENKSLTRLYEARPELDLVRYG